jgi:hypothetical protein
MSNLPDSHFLEVELTAGVWTDITAYIDAGAGGTIQYGRSTQYGPPNAATFQITLDNADGRFTPLRQTLSDGTTAHPYYPNLTPRKRIRFGYVKTAVRYTRFTGYLRGWPPSLLNGETQRVTLSAVDRSLQLQQYKLKAGVTEHINLFRTDVYNYWTLGEPAGDSRSIDFYGGVPLVDDGLNPVVFGGDGAGVGNGTSALFTASSASVGSSMTGRSTWSSILGMTLIVWVKPTVSGTGWTQTIATADTAAGSLSAKLTLSAAGAIGYADSAGSVTTGSTAPAGVWTMLALTVNNAGTLITLWKNGVSIGTLATFFPVTSAVQFRLGAGLSTGGNPFGGSIAHVALLDTDASSVLPTLYNVGQGAPGETVDARIARWLSYAGLTAADYNLDTSTVTLATFDQSGKTPFDAGQELIDSEGGGSALYVDTDNRVRFVNRNRLLPGVPVVTLDAEADLDGGTWEPAYDADNLVNSSVGSRASISGTDATVAASDTASITTFGPGSGDFTSYSQSDSDVLYNAQARVAAGKTPGYRLNRVSVDLWTAQNNLYAALSAVRIGDRIRVSNIPLGGAPATQLDLIVEGWADTFSADNGWTVAFDTIPADNPAWFVWEDATTVGTVTGAYSRWQEGNTVLISTISASATSLDFGVAFSALAGSYPITIKVEEEHICLNSPPVGTVYSGVTRGVDGTTAAIHTVGGPTPPIRPSIVPGSTWTL